VIEILARCMMSTGEKREREKKIKIIECEHNNLHFINHEISCHYLIFILCLLHVHFCLCIQKAIFLLSLKRLLNGQLLAGKIHLIGLGGLSHSLTHCLTCMTELSIFLHCLR
jgi:hypothetical protein